LGQSPRTKITIQATDILIVTKFYPATINAELWKAGINEPFEIHVQPPKKVAFYKKKSQAYKNIM
jgi:hypothetical protein